MSLHTFACPFPAAQARHILVLTAIAWCIAFAFVADGRGL